MNYKSTKKSEFRSISENSVIRIFHFFVSVQQTWYIEAVLKEGI